MIVAFVAGLLIGALLTGVGAGLLALRYPRAPRWPR